MMKVALAVMPVLLSACLGDIPPDHPTGPTAAGTARTMFDVDVYPIVDNQCAGCHAARPDVTQFVALDRAMAYGEIVGAPTVVGDFHPATAPILAKVAAGHMTTSYTPDQLGAITAWLEQEISERGPAPPPFPDHPDPVQALEKTWSGCLTLPDFASANMAQAWGNLQTEDTSTCASCHTNGGYGMVASDYQTTFFNLLTRHSGFMLQYFAPDATEPSQPRMVINTFSFMQVSQALDKHGEHPLFDPTLGLAALQTFYDAAIAKLANGQCGAPTLQD